MCAAGLCPWSKEQGLPRGRRCVTHTNERCGVQDPKIMPVHLYTWIVSHLSRAPLATSSLKEGAAGAVEESVVTSQCIEPRMIATSRHVGKERTAIQCDMLRPSALVARQREVERVSVDALDCPTVPDGCMATKNGRPKLQDGRRFLLGQPKQQKYHTKIPE
jgi:hypothetical protein